MILALEYFIGSIFFFSPIFFLMIKSGGVHELPVCQGVVVGGNQMPFFLRLSFRYLRDSEVVVACSGGTLGTFSRLRLTPPSVELGRPFLFGWNYWGRVLFEG